MSRALHGAIAGVCATMAMTMVMRLLGQHLDREDRYPLPPREITQVALRADGHKAAMLTLLAHFGFGAFAGALYGLLPLRVPGVLFGPLVWATSYLGWIPLAGVLTSATRHPRERNRLMIVAHLIWGVCTAVGTRELDAAARTIFAEG